MEENYKTTYANCWNCGWKLEFDPGREIIICPACGRRNERPKATGDTLNQLNLGYEYWKNQDFAEAEKLFNYVVQHQPNESRAFWGKVLCKYGIEYQAKGESHIILCHFISEGSIYNDVSYKQAILYAPENIGTEYRLAAEKVDEIQKRVQRRVNNAEPWDIFLCYKESVPGEKNKRTKDSQIAAELYNYFMKGGYRTFYARESLYDSDIPDAEYEAIIYHALYTAKVMIVLATKPEYPETTWMHSEWSRFLENKKEGDGKRFVVLTSEVDPDDLPTELSSRNIYDYSRDLLKLLGNVNYWLTSPEKNEKETKYKSAVKKMEAGYYQEALLALEGLSGYKAADRLAEQCRQKMLKEDQNQREKENLFQSSNNKMTPGDFQGELMLNPSELASLGEKAYLNGEYDKALEYLIPAAQAGDANAQFRLGYMYTKGYGVLQSYEKAVEWYQKAANQGEATAQTSIGYMYTNGYGVTQSYEKAVEWYQKAADQGEATAQTSLGYMYTNGYGVTQSYEKAVEWYQKAADQGEATAQTSLGYIYGNGLGVTKSYEKAVEWYQKAADQGEATAQKNLKLLISQKKFHKK